MNSQVDSNYFKKKTLKPIFTISSFGICSDFRNMFANQIINPNKTEREMFDLFKKISSGYLAITLPASFACKHYAYQ